MTTVADFIRARREQLKPADVGLPDSGRRRTPGLRREEVATLAGISIDYLVRLEQGRDTRPSAGVVAALAQALRLDDADRRQLHFLAMVAGNPEPCPAAGPLVRDVPPSVRRLLDRMGAPAFLLGPAADILGWNEQWARLVAPLGVLDGDHGDRGGGGDVLPNLARYTFLHPHARSAMRDWERVAGELVNRLRAAGVHWGDDARLVALVAELEAAPEFASRWSTFGAAEPPRGSRRFAHPELGELAFDYEVLGVPNDESLDLVTWLPADAVTDAAVASLLDDVPSSPPQLRVIG